MATDGGDVSLLGGGVDASSSISVSSSAPTPSLSEPNTVIAYITRVASSILEEDDHHGGGQNHTDNSHPSGQNGLYSVLNDSQELIRKFISDPMAKSLFVQKISNKGNKTAIKKHSICIHVFYF